MASTRISEIGVRHELGLDHDVSGVPTVASKLAARGRERLDVLERIQIERTEQRTLIVHVVEDAPATALQSAHDECTDAVEHLEVQHVLRLIQYEDVVRVGLVGDGLVERNNID